MFEKHQIVGGHYQILDRIGAGGMGMVFRALDTNLHREIALKFMHKELLENPDALDRFMAEGRVLASLRHTNVVEVYTLEIDEASRLPFLVMECIKGKSLSTFLKDVGSPIRLVIEIFLQVLDGIEACHEKGVVHRDIKPENILVDEHEKTKIVDFGIAKTSHKMTRTGMALGTARYMSPEQCLGKSGLTQKSDIYSLGILLWELLLGAPPFTATDEASDSNIAVALMHLHEPVPMKVIQEKSETRPFGPLLEKMLAKATEDRPDIGQIRTFLQTELQKMSQSTRPGETSPKPPSHKSLNRGSAEELLLSPTPPGKDPSPPGEPFAGAPFTRIFLPVGAVLFFCCACLWGIATGKITINSLLPSSPIPADGGAGAKEITNSLGMKLRLIPAGTFLMGSPAAEENRESNEIQHQVHISEPFYLGVFEVTQAEWQAVMGSTIRQQRDKAGKEYNLFGEGENFPMYYVSWDEAKEFSRKLSEREGESYRLPSEAEWEYACRAGSTGPFSEELGDEGWYAVNSGKASVEKLAELEKQQEWGKYFDLVIAGEGSSHPVGGKKANAWGLYDMHGNVWEWCQDWHDSSYYEKSPATAPPGAETGLNRVDRGGGWSYSARGCRSAFRGWYHPAFRCAFLGFRLVRNP